MRSNMMLVVSFSIKVRLFIATAFSLLLVSCGASQKTLGDLRYQPKQNREVALEKMEFKDVRKEYQDLLKYFKDDELKEEIERRIADVYMIEGEKKQLEEMPQKSYYIEAIKNYEKILKKYPGSPNNADVLYQLARAYELEGNQDKALETLQQLTRYHPDFKSSAEVHFRLGDIYYLRKKYREAEKEFFMVTQYQEEKLDIYSHYMLGWAQYKQYNINPSLDSFAYVFNKLIEKERKLGELSKAEKPLVKDTLDAISLGVSKNGGAAGIEKIQSLKERDYIWMLYDNLGEYYLAKERFEDSAETYRTYVNKYNYAAQAPRLHSKLIDTYIKGGFPVQALNEKETYVNYYNIHSRYAKNVGGLSIEIRSKLKTYYDELARHFHNLGQKHQKTREKYVLGKAFAKAAEQLEKRNTTLRKAAGFYGDYLETFPGDDRKGEVTYLRAEANYLAENYAISIADYEAVAYEINQQQSKQYENDAGYAAIVAYQKLIKENQSNQQVKDKWQSQAVESMLRFAAKFRNDKRSPAVLANAAEYLFGLEDYLRALKVAGELVKNEKNIDRELAKTAYGIIAHSHFKLNDFASAEKSYLVQREYTQKDSNEYGEISERLAAAMYKNAESMIDVSQSVKAAEKLLEIKKLSPNSKIRSTAQYDAIALLTGANLWLKAIPEIKQMIELFPNFKNAEELPRTLALAYEKTEQWNIAATHYYRLSREDKDADVRRTTLFLAATMYEKSKNYDTAIKLFRDYARAYEQPFDVRMEARYHLAELYEKNKEMSKHLFWLRRIIDGDSEAGSERTERSQWLAAWANIKYGDYFAWEFNRKKLRLPLSRSLPRKNEALKNATDRYKRAANYGILEFVTMSSYKMAQMYQQLVTELKAAPIPSGLSASDQEGYRQIIEAKVEPFLNAVVELHEGNVMRAWDGQYNEWIEKSFVEMAKLKPQRYAKKELEVSYGDQIW
ncbi:tetratricopeptide repeat protein [Aliikangiella sp. G2MR2-5]|uniref:tetratricopeptide repeat protein n=1 Tax=Aliikangiella sp. G2MR2-5 TaxID=2788943 RepID=UPI0018AC5A4B|nr:tetratricopeptide repeat protein [Aliikangiella sp. G2MR2-5]